MHLWEKLAYLGIAVVMGLVGALEYQMGIETHMRGWKVILLGGSGLFAIAAGFFALLGVVTIYQDLRDGQ
jgi:hypothetical protein